MIRTVLLILGCISFIIVIGGATYEHAAVVPQWTAAVPASLSMFQGEYGLRSANFWIPVHPVTMALLVAALVTNWRTTRRNYIITTIAGYAIILAATFVYFVPELMSLVQTAYSSSVDSELTHRANTWEFLSIVRLGCLIVLAVILLMGLSKPVQGSLE
ncbi:MAG TPA: hypothetical protein VFZ23_08305 [Pyrinomonadaceae bacterium]